MPNDISFIFKLFSIGIKSPYTFLKKISTKNIYTLKEALKFERKEDIEKNFKTLIQEDKPLQVISTANFNSPPAPPSISNEEKYLKKHTTKLSSLQKINSSIQKNSFYLKKNIAIIADLNLPQCKKYRVLQKVEVLKKLNYNCTFSHWEDIPRCLELLQIASTVIFYRIPDTPVTNCYLVESTRLSLNIGYDIDDPIFDEEVYSNNKNLNILSENERMSLLQNTVLYKSFIRKCDFVIASTPGMKKVIKKHTNSPIILWRNLVDSETLNAHKYSEEIYFPKKDTSKNFNIAYMSGSRAHELDFMEAYDGLSKILEEFDFVNLHIVGYADYGKNLKKEFPNQVFLNPFSDYYTYLNKYQNIDLNIIPLLCDDFNNCKSAIRMMEAAMFGIPTMVSNIGDFLTIIENNKNGIIISNNKEWYSQIKYFVNNPKELIRIGKNAKFTVEKELSVESFCNNFPLEVTAQLR